LTKHVQNTTEIETKVGRIPLLTLNKHHPKKSQIIK
jgi:hypothetical protein